MSCRKTLGSHFYPFSFIKNLQLRKSVFLFLLLIRIRILNYLKWIFSNIFAFWINIHYTYSPFKPFLNSRKSCRKTLGPHFYPFSSIKNLQLKKTVFFFLLPIPIRIMSHLKWIFSNIFAFWLIYGSFKPFLNSQKYCHKTLGSHFYLFLRGNYKVALYELALLIDR